MYVYFMRGIYELINSNMLETEKFSQEKSQNEEKAPWVVEVTEPISIASQVGEQVLGASPVGKCLAETTDKYSIKSEVSFGVKSPDRDSFWSVSFVSLPSEFEKVLKENLVAKVSERIQDYGLTSGSYKLSDLKIKLDVMSREPHQAGADEVVQTFFEQL